MSEWASLLFFAVSASSEKSLGVIGSQHSDLRELLGRLVPDRREGPRNVEGRRKLMFMFGTALP